MVQGFSLGSCETPAEESPLILLSPCSPGGCEAMLHPGDQLCLSQSGSLPSSEMEQNPQEISAVTICQ